MKKAYFAGGCFWCITPAFYDTEGVARVTAGFSGGDEPSPSYADVKAGLTGHRETVEIEYDPAAVGYAELVDVLLANIDPFDAGGQYIDRGRSYTAAIYPQTAEERAAAESALSELSRSEGRRAEVAVEDFKSFWRAEEIHQDYYVKNPEAFAAEMLASGRTACPRKARKKER